MQLREHDPSRFGTLKGVRGLKYRNIRVSETDAEWIKQLAHEMSVQESRDVDQAEAFSVVRKVYTEKRGDVEGKAELRGTKS